MTNPFLNILQIILRVLFARNLFPFDFWSNRWDLLRIFLFYQKSFQMLKIDALSFLAYLNKRIIEISHTKIFKFILKLYGSKISCTLLIICFPIIIMASCCDSSHRQPLFEHYLKDIYFIWFYTEYVVKFLTSSFL